MAKRGFIRVDVSGNPLPAGVCGPGQPPTTVPSIGAHHPRSDQALNDCSPGNILRELANRADRKELDLAKKELDRVNMENAHLNAQVAAMSQELNRKTDEIFQGHSEANSARRNFEASAIPWPTRISDWDPIQGGRRGGGCAQFANGCGARGGVQTRKHRKGAGEDSLLSAKEEDHRIREIRTGPVHRSPNRSPINRS